MMEAEMGIVLEFQSLPRERRRPAALALTSNADGEQRKGEVVIFPGIRMDRETAALAGIDDNHRQTGKGSAE